MESLRQVANTLAEQDTKRNEALKDGVKTVPVKDEVLEKLASVVGGNELDEIMSCHPGYDLDGKIKSLQRALETYWRCHADLMTKLDAFDLASKDGTLFNRSRTAKLREHEAACRKEIFALSSAAATLVALTRHVKKIIPEFDEVRAKNFDGGPHAFIIELRNQLNHVKFLESDWSIKNVGPRQTSHFEFKAAKLLRDGDFKGAKTYPQGQQAPIDIRELFETYGTSVRNFYAWLMPEIESRLPAEVKDYRRCIRERQAFLVRSWYRILFTQVVTAQTDLYGHLQEYLTPEEMKEIDAMPQRSKQQIDRIIAIVDEHGACDDELRGLVYKAFGLVA